MPGFPPGVHRIGGRNAAPAHRRTAEFYAPILPIVAELHRQGLSLASPAELDRREFGRGRAAITRSRGAFPGASRFSSAGAPRRLGDAGPRAGRPGFFAASAAQLSVEARKTMVRTMACRTNGGRPKAQNG